MHINIVFSASNKTIPKLLYSLGLRQLRIEKYIFQLPYTFFGKNLLFASSEYFTKCCMTLLIAIHLPFFYIKIASRNDNDTKKFCRICVTKNLTFNCPHVPKLESWEFKNQNSK